MRKGVVRNRCPLCGGKIIVSVLYQISHDHVVTKSGKLTKHFSKSGECSIDAAIAACENTKTYRCHARWETDDFIIDENDQFVDFLYED